MKRYNKFFATKQEAKAFQKENGCGALYSYTKGSRTKLDAYIEASMIGMTVDQLEQTPFVVAWNGKN